MSQITLLRRALQQHLPWHGARLSFMAEFLIALFRVKTVNLTELATGFSGSAKVESHYKRLQRFLRDYEFDYLASVKLIVRWMDTRESWKLSLDRTQWHFGTQVVNILVLGLVHQGVAIPLLWLFLPNRSNAYTYQRIVLMQRLRQWFPDQAIAFVTADREFIGREWIDYLHTQRIGFRIRIRDKELLDDGQQRLSARVLFAHLRPGQTQVLTQPRSLWQQSVWIAALRLSDGELLVVATSDAPDQAISDYGLRWQIETLFGCLKRRGFCLESTHLTQPTCLSKLLALLTIALCWAIRLGEWQTQQQPLPLKKHGRKPKSTFRQGLDALRRIVLNLPQRLPEFQQALQFLSCT